MHRFFVKRENVKGDKAFIEKDESHHIEKVLRLKPGDKIILFDGRGTEYHAVLEKKVNNQLVALIQEICEINNEPPLKVNLVQGIPKGDKMDLVIQKAVELGVASIYPVVTTRTVVKLARDKAVKKAARWQDIAIEACKQCRRNIIPEVKPVAAFSDILEIIGENWAIMLYEKEENARLKNILREKKGTGEQEVFLLVGPEGGFAPHEAKLAQEKGIFLAGLGPRVLRTETAGIAGLSIILYELGDLG
ncbi:16S rRNA (uracil(1498)-N(3))-methyltransferase [Thermosyntropha sp.]|uniref:16S rRNA (uracil(1498)-N(3))-methyltransferase n=1 Tax=Thermosyntropha sp. TaxID=2740820 RepID=UPI0025F8A9F8|nr:16S rRNA (uracil(1498)-N(3))-methyltransferase [Thermosyntropha sp.]MBO8159151.1 16S rRNA (uracil(1498)-N(3))-methyltransferase [Thermosyntropha sp.]